MRETVKSARAASSMAERERILKGKGLHAVDHFAWDMRFSDPYQAFSYDKLHFDDLGKFGKHLWRLILDRLSGQAKTELAANMRRFPRARNLKHFNNVLTYEFSDGETFFHILKQIIPCIVQVLPANSSLVHCLRAYQQYRMMCNMHCHSESRLARMRIFMNEYEKFCMKVGQQYNKNFNFPKQHWTNHAIDDIKWKGTLDNMSTRVGESFFQEAAEAYSHTNGKDAERQMSAIDEKQEAMAQITMAVEEHSQKQVAECMRAERDADEPLSNRGVAAEAADREGDHDEPEPGLRGSDGPPAHWALGSRKKGRQYNSRHFELVMCYNDAAYKDFDRKIRALVAHEFPDEKKLDRDDVLLVSEFQCLYIQFQSVEDWAIKTDILRANPLFHGLPRHDSVTVDTDRGHEYGRLYGLLRITLPSERRFDVGIVRMCKETRKWRPKTSWAGCIVLEEEKNLTFLPLKYVLRQAVLCPTFGSPSRLGSMYYPMDTIDEDMFLRLDES
ncbi:hypothetical protein K523DRAFT_21961 [Schizophyllum commune Tattone D]|nr:hypothetical protein K523DRAFT_21961 [Schizophyllum commune Tattone D]